MMRHYHQMGSTVGSTPIPDEYKKPIFWKSNETCRHDIESDDYVAINNSNMYDRLCQPGTINDITDQQLDEMLVNIKLQDASRIIVSTEIFRTNNKFTKMYTSFGGTPSFYPFNVPWPEQGNWPSGDFDITYSESEGIVPHIINFYWLDNKSYIDGDLVSEAVRTSEIYKAIGSNKKHNTNRTPNIYIAQPQKGKINDLDRMFVNLDCSDNLYRINIAKTDPGTLGENLSYYRPINYGTKPFEFIPVAGQQGNIFGTYNMLWEGNPLTSSNYRNYINFVPFNYRNSYNITRTLTIRRPWSPSPSVEPTYYNYNITLKLHCFRVLSFNLCEEKRIEIL